MAKSKKRTKSPRSQARAQVREAIAKRLGISHVGKSLRDLERLEKSLQAQALAGAGTPPRAVVITDPGEIKFLADLRSARALAPAGAWGIADLDIVHARVS